MKQPARNAVTILFLCCALAARSQTSGPTHTLLASPQTVTWGYYDASTPPVLRIKSGDTVTMHTLVAATPPYLEEAGVKPDQVEPALRAVFTQVTNKGPGGHILTGPIFIEGALPGGVLEVRIKSVQLAVPYAVTAFAPNGGWLPEDFPHWKIKMTPLDEQRLIGRFAPGVEIPLRPFFGSMGVAPPHVSGRISSNPPWIHGGNIDNKELVAGTTLYLPIHAPGALFQAGDGHANQGNGEVCGSALETSLRGTFQFVVHNDLHLHWPRAETPTAFITMGIDEDLTKAAKLAVREMVDFLVTTQGLTADEAYLLTSVAADVNITQLVDGNKGVHAIIPKALFQNRAKR